MKKKINVKDLVIEYIAFKAKFGWEPIVTDEEIIEFIKFFEYTYEIEGTFSNIGKEEIIVSNITKKDNKILVANNNLCKDDLEVLTTSSWLMKERDKMHYMMLMFSAKNPRKQLKDTCLEDDELLLGQYVSANMLLTINGLGNNEFNKYSYSLPYINHIYNKLANRIAMLNKTEDDLKITNNSNIFIPHYNYELIMRDLDRIKISLEDQEFFIDVNSKTIKLNNQEETSLYNSNSKKLVRSLNEKQ